MMQGAYRFLTNIAGLILPWWLAWRAGRGKEDRARLGERKGQASHDRPNGRLVWCHAASVGEALSILPLTEAAHACGCQVLVTTGTLTSARLMAERLPAGVTHQYIPLDHRPWVRRFLDHWKPDLVLWTESELWPNILAEIAARQIPAVLVNGRLSDRAYRGWRRWPAFARSVVGAFTLIIAQSDEDKIRFAALGAKRAVRSGNLKLAAAPLPVDEAALGSLRVQIGQRPRWLAASIHPGEDKIIGEVHRAVKAAEPGLLTILVPRHPQKAFDMTEGLQALGFKVARRSLGDIPARDTDIYMADTMGELGLFYRLCDLAFMGKSLAVGGGQNPAEAAKLGCALLFGADMSNFRDTAAEFLTARAAVQVQNAAELTAAVGRLLRDSPARLKMSENASAVMERHAGAVAETLSHLAPYLDRV